MTSWSLKCRRTRWMKSARWCKTRWRMCMRYACRSSLMWVLGGIGETWTSLRSQQSQKPTADDAEKNGFTQIEQKNFSVAQCLRGENDLYPQGSLHRVRDGVCMLLHLLCGRGL